MKLIERIAKTIQCHCIIIAQSDAAATIYFIAQACAAFIREGDFLRPAFISNFQRSQSIEK